MVTDRIKDALDLLESYVLLHEPGSQSREVGEQSLRGSRDELARYCDGTARGYRRVELLAEISDRATELARDESPEYCQALTARIALGEAERAAVRDPMTGGVAGWRTSSMLRRCALDCAAWALLALEKLVAGLGR